MYVVMCKYSAVQGNAQPGSSVGSSAGKLRRMARASIAEELQWSLIFEVVASHASPVPVFECTSKPSLSGAARCRPSGCLCWGCRRRLAIALSRSLEDVSQAKAAFDEALACGGTDPLVLRESGRYYLKLRDFARAKTLLETALRQNPGDIDSNFEYGRMLAQEGNPKAAISYLEKVRQRVPENGEIRAIYGQSLGQAGDVFHAYLNLTYAAVFENNPMQVKFQLEKTKAAAKTDADRRELAKLEAAIEKRSEFWRKKLLD